MSIVEMFPSLKITPLTYNSLKYCNGGGGGGVLASLLRIGRDDKFSAWVSALVFH